MRKWSGNALALALVASLLLVAPAHAAVQWQGFTHPQYGFSLQYPPGWAVQRPDTQLIAVAIVGPLSSGQLPFHMSVNVVVDSVPAGTPIERFNTVANAGLQKIFPGYRLLRTDRTQLSGRPAVIRYATWRPKDGPDLYLLQMGTIAGTHVYIVSGTTLASSTGIRDEALLLQRILTTFRAP